MKVTANSDEKSTERQPGKIKGMFIALLEQDFARFLVVGLFGFAANLAILTLLYKILHLPIFIAQLISAEVSMLASFFFHNFWTYQARSNKTISQLIVQFHFSSWAGMLLNTAIVSAMVLWVHQNYVFALVMASLLVMFWNYFWTKFYIWRNLQQPDSEDEV